MVDIQYKGAGPAIAALMAGECQMGFQTLLASIGQIKSGRLRALAVTSRKRQPLLIEVPTVAESGAPNYVLEIWVGLVAPASTPPQIVRLLNEHIVKAARSPEVAERFAREGAEVVANTPEQFRKVLADETAMWGKVIKEMGIRGE